MTIAVAVTLNGDGVVVVEEVVAEEAALLEKGFGDGDEPPPVPAWPNAEKRFWFCDGCSNRQLSIHVES